METRDKQSENNWRVRRTGDSFGQKVNILGIVAADGNLEMESRARPIGQSSRADSSCTLCYIDRGLDGWALVFFGCWPRIPHAPWQHEATEEWPSGTHHPKAIG
jgi:hypothetical protein